MKKKLPLIKVNQWLDTWGQENKKDVEIPPDHFYIGSMPLKTLRKMSSAHRRDIAERQAGSKDAGIQRKLEQDRSNRISRYISYGYPMSSDKTLNPENHKKLINPGWLPTGILINILKPGDVRRRKGKDLTLNPESTVEIIHEQDLTFLEYDENHINNNDSDIDELDPLEIIDGQHRLYAADNLSTLDESYEVPVIFFHGLPQTWQAYLFWVINVEPKKINQSLAFDLYPELRSQDWLDMAEGIKVYLEHRAQELTEILWRHPNSAWKDRIELHGSRIDGHVSNASFIRSLLDTFVRRWSNEARIGGLYGSIDKVSKERVLPWKRSQQAAFLIFIWDKLHAAIKDSDVNWVKSCFDAYKSLDKESKQKINPNDLHPAFAGNYTLLATDQGVRAYLRIINSMMLVRYDDLNLESFEIQSISDESIDIEVSEGLEKFQNDNLLNQYLTEIISTLINSNFDFRVSSAPGLSSDEMQKQAAFRGAPGYSLLEQKMLFAIKDNTKDTELLKSLDKVIELRGFNAQH